MLDATALAVDVPQTKGYWRAWHTVSMLLFVIGVVAIGMLMPLSYRPLTWIANIALLLVFVVILGNGTTGKWRGALIDDRNKISLSRTQTLAWTILILSAFLTAALTNIGIALQGKIDLAAISQALRISVPSDLWVLMGISFTSLIGTPLIHDYKKKQINDLPVDTTKSIKQGSMVMNKSINAAQWSDMFKGEEPSNENCLDIGKVQMFYFTVLLVFAYAVSISTLFISSTTPFHDFPILDGSLIALLGISHAGYLANKAIPRNASGPVNTPPAAPAS